MKVEKTARVEDGMMRRHEEVAKVVEDLKTKQDNESLTGKKM